MKIYNCQSAMKNKWDSMRKEFAKMYGKLDRSHIFQQGLWLDFNRSRIYITLE